MLGKKVKHVIVNDQVKAVILIVEIVSITDFEAIIFDCQVFCFLLGAAQHFLSYINAFIQTHRI